jgi:hypothetical protein
MRRLRRRYGAFQITIRSTLWSTRGLLQRGCLQPFIEEIATLLFRENILNIRISFDRLARAFESPLKIERSREIGRAHV